MKRTAALIGLPFIVSAGIFAVLFHESCAYVMSNHPRKELPFNHRAHVESYGAACETCHGYYDDGRFKGIPTVAECFGCHDRNVVLKTAGGGTSDGRPFFAGYRDTDRPWEAKAKQPRLVYFSHAVVMNARNENGMKKARCRSCHGDKAESTQPVGLTGKMLMGQCVDCHTEMNVSNTCGVCHD